MYVEHVDFKKPADEEIKIWRYMDFTRFISFLDKKSLFFTRVDKFEDVYEGAFSEVNRHLRPQFYENPLLASEKVNSKIEELVNCTKPFLIANCWHLNEYESDAMWKLYLKNNEGIAIQSTFRKFSDSFRNTPEDVFIGKINYIDYKKDWMNEGNIYYPFLHKRKSYDHEKELRAFVDLSHYDNDDSEFININRITGPKIEVGQYIKVNLETLIENIYVSPKSQPWFTALVKSVIEKYGLNKPVEQSKMNNLY